MTRWLPITTLKNYKKNYWIIRIQVGRILPYFLLILFHRATSILALLSTVTMEVPFRPFQLLESLKNDDGDGNGNDDTTNPRRWKRGSTFFCGGGGAQPSPPFWRIINNFLFFLPWSTHQDLKTQFLYKTLIDWVSNESVRFPAFNFVVCVTNFVTAGSHFKKQEFDLFYFTENSWHLR